MAADRGVSHARQLLGLSAPERSEADLSRTLRDCLDHVVLFGERHLGHLLESYQRYYNEARTHLSLSKDAPVSRAVQTVGRIIPKPRLGGLYHHYLRILFPAGTAVIILRG
jgi:hypothetical protein